MMSARICSERKPRRLLSSNEEEQIVLVAQIAIPVLVVSEEAHGTS